MAITVDKSRLTTLKPSGRFWLLLVLLGGCLAILCRQGFLPYEVFWANDAALGAMSENSARLPGTFTGYWGDFWWIGGATASSSPSLVTLLATLLSPASFLKIYAPLTMLFLGCCAWFFFRELGFGALACVIGGLGAGLNMHFFSVACWGLGTWNVASGMVFVALGILVSPSIRPAWIKAALAGLSVGMVVMEGFDVGAILSLYIAVFLVFYFISTAAKPEEGVVKSIWMGALVVGFAFFIAASTLYTLVGTQISGTAAVAQNARDKKAKWDFTTQWSVPKLETLRVIIPGIFGYRLQEYITDEDKSSAFWGNIAQDPRVEDLESSNPQTRAEAAAFIGLQPDLQRVMAGDDAAARENLVDQIKGHLQRRHSGSGEYAGILVCLLAVFGLCAAGQKVNSPYSLIERRMVWFWGGAALFSLLAAWGRHGFIYQFLYHLPYFSNIRNPMKFMHPLNISLIILSGFGLEALDRRYLRMANTRSDILPQHVVVWWKKVKGFEKKWAVGTVIALGVAVVAYLIMSGSKIDLVHYLEHNGFSVELSPKIANFATGEMLLFVLFFGLSIGAIICILSGAWSGRRMIWAWTVLVAIMLVDLGHSDVPWIRYFNYKEKYSTNAIFDYLRKEPWEHRVVSRLSPMGGYDISGDANVGAVSHWWLENDLPYNNIESLEIDQAPRMPDLDRNYLDNFMVHSQNDLSPPVRLWRLTNTRYVMADARVVPALNQLAQPQNSFRTVMRMDLTNKPAVTHVEDAGDLTVVTNENGALALIEFTQALPRAKLFSNWQTIEDKAALEKLNSVEFDPARTVLIASDTPVTQSPAHPEMDPGTVSITSYKPKDITLHADAKTEAVLLLNDRTGDYWNVWIDQKAAALLRCNYIMRGVMVPPGEHTIEFRFQPPLKWLHVSMAAFAVGILLTGFVLVTGCRKPN